VRDNPLSLARYFLAIRKVGQLTWVRDRFDRYGDVYSAPFRNTDVVILRHPDDIHDVLVKQASSFKKLEDGITFRQLSELLGNGLLNTNGDFWRRQRRMIQPGFMRARLEGYAELMGRFATEHVGRWKDGQSLDVNGEMMELTQAIVAKTLFNHDITGDTDRVAEAMRTFRTSFGGIGAILPDWIPTPGKRKARQARNAMDDVVYGLIDNHDGSEGDDLLSTLLAAVDEEGDGKGMDRKQLRDELLTLFIAGHDTTAHALTWALYLLAQNPDAEQRLQAEADLALSQGPLDFHALERLPYTEQVINETLRLYPPAYAVPRQAKEDVTIGGYHVPAGAHVVIWIYHVHHDARWYPEPERFDPSRFEPERMAKLPRAAHLPFGAGTRACIGKHFALYEARLVLAAIAAKVRLRVEPGHVARPNFAVTLAPDGGMPMTVEARPAR